MGYIVLGITGLFLYVVEFIRRRMMGLPTNAIEEYYQMINEYSESKIKSLKKMPYRNYLKTYHWQVLREAVFKYHGKRCYDCGLSHWWTHMEAHHLTYENMGHEKLDDLVPLCRGCHKKRHGR
ncbi:MAG: hypothetical protein GX201_07005 [Clostridiales bacterium]|nr:hypothetical protein [Clostridiales bacterium]